MAPRLEITALSCGRGERALFRDLDFELHAGEVARVLGANGCGKTTLLRTIAGRYRPYAGAVRWHAQTEAGAEPALLHEQLCFVGHDNALDDALTPMENLDLLLRIAGRSVAAARIQTVLGDLGLERVANRACGRLSAGQRRRVSLARLWLSQAPLWLLDEPAAALDSAARTVLGARIAEHARAGGLVLFTTHEQFALPGVATRAIELRSC